MVKESNGESLSLDVVVRRFADAEQTLTQVQEHLRGILVAEERTDLAAQALDTAATSVTDLARAASAIVDALHGAQSAVVDAMQTAKGFLEASDLTVLSSQIAASTEALSAVIQELAKGQRQSEKKQKDAIGESSELLMSRLDQLESRMVDLEAAREAEAQLRNELASIKERMPDRMKRKLGVV